MLLLSIYSYKVFVSCYLIIWNGCVCVFLCLRIMDQLFLTHCLLLQPIFFSMIIAPFKNDAIVVTGGIAELPCPYKCISDRYHMPHCYTALEELIYTFGGPWLFCLILLGLLILLALVLSVARMKFVGTDELPGPAPTHQGSQIDHSFPFLESLNEVIFLFIVSNRSPMNVGQHALWTLIWSSLCIIYYLFILRDINDTLHIRSWKQIEWKNHKVMCIECTLWDLIHSVNLGIYLIHPQSR